MDIISTPFLTYSSAGPFICRRWDPCPHVQLGGLKGVVSLHSIYLKAISGCIEGTMGEHGEPVVVEIAPSAFGFRNIRPKKRKERIGMKDKVALERSRLMERSGWQARMHQKNAPETTAGLTSCRPGDEGYLSNSDRFHSDTVGEQLLEREEAAKKRHAAHLFRRENARKRDEERWERTERLQHMEEERIQRVREDPTLMPFRGPKKNVSNVAYDITNLQYKQDTSGEAQQYYDNMVRFRAQARTRALVVLGGSRAPYDILTGMDRSLPPKPADVQRPYCLDNPELMGKPINVDKRKVLAPELRLGGGVSSS